MYDLYFLMDNLSFLSNKEEKLSYNITSLIDYRWFWFLLEENAFCSLQQHLSARASCLLWEKSMVGTHRWNDECATCLSVAEHIMTK